MSGPGAAEALHEPWRSLRRQREGTSFGTWVFLGSEIMMFGGLILAYAVNRALHPDAFAAGGKETSIIYGTVNTAVLLTSSLTMAVGSEAARAGLRRLALRTLLATIALGCAFLAIKGFEYNEDIAKGMIPGPEFPVEEPAAQIFWAFYWIMTALHALHLTVGIGLVSTFTYQYWRLERAHQSPAFEGIALYWHLVDIIWVFLYPLFYLMGRNS